ncbi:hypothetical protein D3C85_1638690 [compost metagenome]
MRFRSSLEDRNLPPIKGAPRAAASLRIISVQQQRINRAGIAYHIVGPIGIASLTRARYGNGLPDLNLRKSLLDLPAERCALLSMQLDHIQLHGR